MLHEEVFGKPSDIGLSTVHSVFCRLVFKGTIGYYRTEVCETVTQRQKQCLEGRLNCEAPGALMRCCACSQPLLHRYSSCFYMQLGFFGVGSHAGFIQDFKQIPYVCGQVLYILHVAQHEPGKKIIRKQREALLSAFTRFKAKFV